MLNNTNVRIERKRVVDQIKRIDLRLKALPNKTLYCIRDGTTSKWYEKNGKKRKYISKKRRAYAEELAERKYLTLLRKDLMQEKIALDFYLRHHHTVGKNAEELLENNSAYAELLTKYFAPKSKELQEWMNSPYEKNETYPENLVHKTVAGIKVRSKSEAQIIMVLKNRKIPFRYENALHLGELTFYPDFTLRHPQTGQYYYYEHFGMMDDAEYREKAFKKLRTYAARGIILGINLLATYETKEFPLEVGQVESMLEYYLG